MVEECCDYLALSASEAYILFTFLIYEYWTPLSRGTTGLKTYFLSHITLSARPRFCFPLPFLFGHLSALLSGFLETWWKNNNVKFFLFFFYFFFCLPIFLHTYILIYTRVCECVSSYISLRIFFFFAHLFFFPSVILSTVCPFLLPCVRLLRARSKIALLWIFKTFSVLYSCSLSNVNVVSHLRGFRICFFFFFFQ